MSYASVHGRCFPLLAIALFPLVLSQTGCSDSSSSSSSPPPVGDTPPDVMVGTFVDSPVSGLNYQGTDTPAGVTDEEGRFNYRSGENISFSIGDLSLGSAQGAAVLTPLSVTEGAASAQDPEVINKLILLQTLDADGDSNNGIQLTEAIRTEVAFNENAINFAQPPSDFRASLAPIMQALNEAGAFTDATHGPAA